MRVGLVVYGSLDAISGGFLYDRKLVEYLQSQSDYLQVISLPWGSYAHHLLDNLSADLYRQLVRLDVDVLLQDELNHPSLFWINRRVKPKVGYPVVSIVHHLRISEAKQSGALKLYRQVERAYLNTVDGLIFNSQNTRKVVQTLAGGDRKPSVVACPSGQFSPKIDASEIQGRAHWAGPLKLLFIGNLIPRKGLHTLLAAVNSLPQGMATLTVVGGYLSDSDYARNMLSLISTGARGGEKQDRIRYLGVLPEDQLADVIREHHVIAVPSSYEGYGIVYLEGMGFGLPAIATTQGGAGEIVTHGQDGYLVTPEDPNTLAWAIRQLATNRDLLAEFSLAAFRCYQNHPTWSQTGEKIRQFIQNLAVRRNTVD